MASARPNPKNTRNFCIINLGCTSGDVKYWQDMEPSAAAMVFEVTPLSDEWMDVAAKFHDSLNYPEFTLVRIHRVQNPVLWAHFALKRKQIVHDLNGLDADERRLFHGTYRENLEAIARKGFDVRIGKKHGKMYGEGTYFAKDASFAHTFSDCGGNRISARWNTAPPVATPFCPPYMDPNVFLLQRLSLNPNLPYCGLARHAPPTAHGAHRMPLNVFPEQPPSFQMGTSDIWPVFNLFAHPRSHFMISSRVLVGRYTQGYTDLRRPPPYDHSDPLVKLYDTCVDNICNPKMFVVFDHNQTYPEHVVEYIWARDAQLGQVYYN